MTPLRFLPALLLVAPAFSQEILLEAHDPGTPGQWASFLAVFGEDLVAASAGTQTLDVYGLETGHQVTSVHHPVDGSQYGARMTAGDQHLFVANLDHQNPDGTMGRVHVYDSSYTSVGEIDAPDLNMTAFGFAMDAAYGRVAIGSPEASGFAGQIDIYDEATLVHQTTIQIPGAPYFGMAIKFISSTELVVGGLGGAWLVDINSNVLVDFGANASTPLSQVWGTWVTVNDGKVAICSSFLGVVPPNVFDLAGNEIAVLPTGLVEFDNLTGNLFHDDFSNVVTILDPQTFSVIENVIQPPATSSFGFWGVGMHDGLIVLRGDFWDPAQQDNFGSLWVYRTGTPIGTSYCAAQPNSTGLSAELDVVGDVNVASNSLSLQVENVPAGEFCMFLNSPAQGFIQNPAGSEGDLCLSGPIGRHNLRAKSAGPNGILCQALDLRAIPRPNGQPPVAAVLPGDTFNFQAWYRDGSANNFSSAVTVTFN